MSIFPKKKFCLAVCLISFFVFLVSVFYCTQKEQSLTFHSVWTETDKKQITEIAEYWKHFQRIETSQNKSGWDNFIVYIYSLKNRWTIKPKKTDGWFSSYDDVIYETAESGNFAYVGEYDCTLLQLACALGKTELALHLIEAGAPADLCYKMPELGMQGHSPLTWAIEGGCDEEFLLIAATIQKRAFIGEKGMNKYPFPLEQRLVLIEALAAKGADMNASYTGMPVVYWACLLPNSNPEEKKQIFFKLEERGADIKTPLRNSLGLISPLFFGVASHSPAIVRKMCEEGVDPNNSYITQPFLFHCIDNLRNSPSSTMEIIQILFEHGINADLLYRNLSKAKEEHLSETPLAYLCSLPLYSYNADVQKKAKELLDLLIEKGADINNASDKGYTPLMLICGNMVKNNTISNIGMEIARTLLDKGADPSLKDNKGYTAWDRQQKISPERKQAILEKLPELKPSH